VSLDSFTKVKQMMDEMVATLKEEQQEEVKFKAYCTKEFSQNEKDTFEKTEIKEDLESKIESLTTLIKKLTKEIAEANTEIAETQVNIKKASQLREKQNAEFQSVIGDQRATQAILKKALTRLQDFYVKDKGSAMVLAQQEPPVKFNSYGKNKGASPVMGLLEQIIEDSKALEADATKTETEQQADYEAFVKDSNSLVKQLSTSVADKTKATSAAKSDLANAESDLDSTNGELEGLGQYNADLHAECDFVMKNFDIRQKGRLQEIEAIQAAKGILSGA
jgi:chromosome segregation ATPase